MKFLQRLFKRARGIPPTLQELAEANERLLGGRSLHFNAHLADELDKKLHRHPTEICSWQRYYQKIRGEVHNEPVILRVNPTRPECLSCMVEDPYE